MNSARYFSDHMFVVDYRDGEWQDAQIVPYGDMTVSPANSALHYGQAIFEGMKAYHQADGGVALFRPLDNWARLNTSAERMCMPTISEELFMSGPHANSFKLDAGLGALGFAGYVALHPARSCLPPMASSGCGLRRTYRLVIFTCPVGLYFTASRCACASSRSTCARPKAARATPKTPATTARPCTPPSWPSTEGYNQLIWTDASEHRYVEESGTMNAIFVIDGRVVTPALSTSILDGVTRRSVLALARDMGLPVEERRVSSREIMEALAAGKLEEAFGAGTAATIAPIATIGYEGHDYDLPTPVRPDAFSQARERRPRCHPHRRRGRRARLDGSRVGQ